jgi:hypothetical protein
MVVTRRAWSRALMVVAAIAMLLVGVHMAYRNQSVALPTVGLPVLHVVAQGRVTRLGNDSLTINLEDREGLLTGVHREIRITDKTHIVTPGESPASGPAGLKLIEVGDRVIVHGRSTTDSVILARTLVAGPGPVDGVIAGVSNGQLKVTVPGQAAPVAVALTSSTAFFVPEGQWQLLTVGARVRVSVRAGPDKSLTAIIVRVVAPTGGS